MLHLVLNREPYWLDLIHGVRVKVLPCTTALFTAAKSAPEFKSLPDDDLTDQHWAVLVSAVAKLAIIEWEGVGDELGDPIAPTEAAIAALLDLFAISQTFGALYLKDYLMMTKEKKGFAPAPNGPSARAPSIAEAAEQSAPNAPMSSISPKPSKAGRSGTSPDE